MRPPAEGASMPLLSTTHKNGPLYQAFSCPHLGPSTVPQTGQDNHPYGLREASLSESVRAGGALGLPPTL